MNETAIRITFQMLDVRRNLIGRFGREGYNEAIRDAMPHVEKAVAKDRDGNVFSAVLPLVKYLNSFGESTAAQVLLCAAVELVEKRRLSVGSGKS